MIKKLILVLVKVALLPRGVVHHITNNTTKTAKALAMMTPALIGINYFKEMSALLNTGTAPDLQKIQETMLRKMIQCL